MTDKSSEAQGSDRLLSLTAQITAAYVGNNTLPAAEIPFVISTVYVSLLKIGSGATPTEGRPEPAVSVKKSVFPDYIICLEDGKKLKMLKRHLKTAYNMTPEQYRERWNLGSDYPVVAPNYAKQRSRLAKQIGLGTSKRIAK